MLRGSNWVPTLKEVRMLLVVPSLSPIRQANSETSQINVLICTPSILSLKRPEDLPNIAVVATAGERSNQL